MKFSYKKTLTLLLVACISLYLWSNIFVKNNEVNTVKITSSYIINDNYEGISKVSQVLADQIVLGNGSWNHTFNSVGLNKGNTLNIYYNNTNSDQARVTLQRRTLRGWTNVGSSFTVNPGSEVTVQRAAATNTEHRLMVENLTGGQVSGSARVRQL